MFQASKVSTAEKASAQQCLTTEAQNRFNQEHGYLNNRDQVRNQDGFAVTQSQKNVVSRLKICDHIIIMAQNS